MNMNYKAKVSAYTLGCKVNQYDTLAMLEILENDGFQIVKWGESADIFLINTCTVTNNADKKSRNAISQARNKNKNAKIIVCGCMAQSSAAELLKSDNVSAVIGTNNRLKIAEAANACLTGEYYEKNTIKNCFVFEPLKVNGTGERTRAYIKVQEGCKNYCSYCIIPFVRGAPRSRPLKDAVREAVRLASSDVKELVITGVNLTSYKDESDNSFVDLIEQITKSAPMSRVRLGSLDVYNLSGGDLIRLSEIENLCPHFHISLQSGSDGVLKRMGRKYTVSEFEKYISDIRKYWSKPAITTDIITGFPAESDTEFNETLKFVKDIEFSRVHVFPYSKRKGTKAAQMKDEIPGRLKKERTRELIEIGKISEYNYIDSLIGCNAKILLERNAANGLIGYSERYIETVCPNGEKGEIINAKLIKRVNNTAYARPVN